jgi:hypothetical protein
MLAHPIMPAITANPIDTADINADTGQTRGEEMTTLTE